MSCCFDSLSLSGGSAGLVEVEKVEMVAGNYPVVRFVVVLGSLGFECVVRSVSFPGYVHFRSVAEWFDVLKDVADGYFDYVPMVEVSGGLVTGAASVSVVRDYYGSVCAAA